MTGAGESLRRRGIVAGGNWIVDRVKIIDRWPAQDALATILAESASNGGSAYNVLKNLARLGAGFPLEGVGLVGNDNDGRFIAADCRAQGIAVTGLRTTTVAATSYTDVMTERSNGRRTFFHQRGANALLDVNDFDFSASRARIFHLGYLLLLDRLDASAEDGVPRAAAVLAAARAAGLKTSVDLVSEDSDRFEAIVTPVLPHVDYLFANDFEAERLTSLSLQWEGQVHAAAVGRAARELIKGGVREWAVIHFPQAAYACNHRGEGLWQPSLRVPPDAIQGAAGAGDAFAAGVLLGLHDNWPMAECLRLGVCTAAASLYHPSCSEGVRSIEECLALEQKLGFQPLPR